MLVIKNAQILDPGSLDTCGDVLIENGKIAAIGSFNYPADARVIDAQGFLLVPGLIDMHVHLRDPGQTHKETIATGCAAAVRGGFTNICCMANTTPINDNPKITKYIIDTAAALNLCHVHPFGAVTKNFAGKELTDFEALQKAGAAGFSDDGVPVLGVDILKQCLIEAAKLKLPVINHCEDTALINGKTIVREGGIAAKLGVQGIPTVTETNMVARDLAVAEAVGLPLHIAHVSTKESVAVIRAAKQRGVKVTAETAPHYFTLTYDALLQHGTNAKMNPPLGSEDDRAAVRQALLDGTIDVIATDHAPHTQREKARPFIDAPNGIVGLETALTLSLALVHQHNFSLATVICALTRNPAKILGIPCGIHQGAPANLTLVNLYKPVTIDKSTFLSKSCNTPFSGMQTTGAPVMTIVDGKIVWQA